ncbi:hypothetical protein GCM10009837_14130 [Streptomyces durmitorensis]|uniref:Uncharacterized protein n=1 Tax=Streptomyces durmitorensis TaxID=319947 RepID=A0ABY4PZR5_9ACTN|nr:hypothetical protein [Streptomyces durmitorensis]UQT58333.1 hypothetical protein M4V62_26440 [Streptomyces durmitorensis]
MRIRTVLAATALAAAAVLGAGGTALANEEGGMQGGFAFENLGGAAGITEGAGHGEGGYDKGMQAGGFAFENLGGPAGITKGAGYHAGGFDGQFNGNH